jgi:hypothetical protein
MQNEPILPHWQVPSRQNMKPQQSSELLQRSPAPTQQRGKSGAGRQTEPAQQRSPGRMPPSKQEMLGPRQVLHSPD